MPYDISNYLVVGVSSRALFDMTVENELFEQKGLKAYREYQIENENIPLKKGTAFPLVEALLRLNKNPEQKKQTEIIIMSKNAADTSLRLFNSIDYYGLDITRATLAGGAPIAPYLEPLKVDLFLSANAQDVKEALQANIAAGLIFNAIGEQMEPIDQIRIAFDGDAVIFSDEAEKIYQEQGLEAFIEHERQNANTPLPKGPFAKLLKTISTLQDKYDREHSPIRTALVTARNTPAKERVIRTLREWDIRIDEAFFMGGMDKTQILKAFNPHIYFDDQEVHCNRSANSVPTARVIM